MPHDLFWFGEPRLVISYREAHELKNEEKNQELWIAGLYNYKGFASVVEALAYGFGGGKGKKPSRYPETPIPLTEREQKAESERKRQQTLAWVEAHQ